MRHFNGCCVVEETVAALAAIIDNLLKFKEFL
jgi:hypothetical protein